MKKRLMAAFMIGGLLASLPAAVSAAPEGGCPTDGRWQLETLLLALPGVDVGDLADANGDGYGCYKVVRHPNWESIGGFMEVWVWMENTEPLSV
jgi:hypothetical protein